MYILKQLNEYSSVGKFIALCLSVHKQNSYILLFVFFRGSKAIFSGISPASEEGKQAWKQ
jgi:hypothetical protein